MTALPVANYFTGGINNGQAKSGFNDILAYLRQSVLGSGPSTELTISGGSVDPTGPFHTIDTEADAASDNLDRFGLTNIQEGQLVLFGAQDTGRTVVVRSGQGGLGQFLLQGSVDFGMQDIDMLMIVVRIGNDIREVMRAYGADAANLRAFIGLGDVAGLDVGDGLANNGGDLDVELDGVNSGLAVAAGGLSIDTSTLAALTAPAADDTVPIYDLDLTTNNKITLANLLKVLNSLTEETTNDPDNDYFLMYDASESEVRKVKGANFAAGGWTEISGSPFTLTGANSGAVLDSIFAEGDKDYLLEFNSLSAANTQNITITAFVGGAEETGTVYAVQGVTSLSTNWNIGSVSHGTAEGMSGHLLVQNPGETDTGFHSITGALSRRTGVSGNYVVDSVGWVVQSAGTLDGLKITLGGSTFAASTEVRVYSR